MGAIFPKQFIIMYSIRWPLSEKIELGRGCKQRDPVSLYLFVMAAEILAEMIRLNREIEGIK